MTPEGSAHSSYGLTDEDIEELRMITSFDPREICRLEEVFYTVANSTTQSMTKEQFFSLASVRSCPLRERIALIFGFPYSIGNDSSLNKPTDPSAAENVGENKADADESTGSDKDDRDSGNKESVEEKEDVSKERPGKHENITKVDQHAINFREFLTAVSMFNSSGMLEQKMKVAFRLQDYDDDGVISELDLTRYLIAVTPHLPEEELNTVVQQILRESSGETDGPTGTTGLTFAKFQQIVAPSDFQAKLRLNF